MAQILKKSCPILYSNIGNKTQVVQVRHRFVNWRMLKDYRKRLEVKKYGPERLRLTVLAENKVLPQELQVIAAEELAALPRNSSSHVIVSRCVVTSRPIGTVKPYRLSRIFFRHLADYNMLAGWQRAMW